MAVLTLYPQLDNEPRLAVRIGRVLRAHRKAKGLTLRDVALKIGTTEQTLQRLETATMTLSVDWVEKICKALQIEPSELFVSTEHAIKLRAREQVISEIADEAVALRSRIDKFIETSRK